MDFVEVWKGADGEERAHSSCIEPGERLVFTVPNVSAAVQGLNARLALFVKTDEKSKKEPVLHIPVLEKSTHLLLQRDELLLSF